LYLQWLVEVSRTVQGEFDRRPQAFLVDQLAQATASQRQLEWRIDGSAKGGRRQLAVR
jgi:hypothetical protein